MPYAALQPLSRVVILLHPVVFYAESVMLEAYFLRNQAKKMDNLLGKSVLQLYHSANLKR
jgi:hypothetical protein